MILYLDTTNRYHRLVQLEKNNHVIDELIVDSDVLSTIEKILQKNNLDIAQIKKMNSPSASSLQITKIDLKVKANPGPGSFTGIRVGLSIANALNYALGHIKDFKNDLQMPKYGSEPRVTIKTKSK